MVNKLRQVLRTYTGWYVLFAVAAWLGFYGMEIFMHRPASFWSPQMRVSVLANGVNASAMPASVLGFAIAFVLKRQFAHPRARLTPGFAGPHLIVAGTIIVAAVAGTAWSLTVRVIGVSTAPAVAFALLELASAVCFAYLVPASGPLMFWLIYAIPSLAGDFQAAATPIAAVILDGDPLVTLTTSIAGLFLLALLGARVTMLREEMPEYSWRAPVSNWPATRVSGRQARGRSMTRSSLLGWLCDAEFRLVSRWLPTSVRLRRLLLRQRVSGFPAVIIMPMQFMQVLPFIWLQSKHLGDVRFGVFGLVARLFATFFPIFIATMFLWGNLAGRRPYLGRDSLLPPSRRELVVGICLSVAWNTAILAVAHCAGVVVGITLFHPSGVTAAIMLPYLALTLVQYVMMYSAVLWFGSLRREVASAVGLLALCALSSAAVTTGLWPGNWLSSRVNVAVLSITAVIVTAAILGRAAFRRWCRVELG